MRVNFKRAPLSGHLFIYHNAMWMRGEGATCALQNNNGLIISRIKNDKSRRTGTRQATCVTDTPSVALVIYLALSLFGHVAKSCRHRSFALRLPKCSSIYLAGALW
jgi:hypothetical protein